MTLPFHDTYQWALRHSTEQGEIPLEEYLWSPEVEKLLFTMTHTNGNLHAVLGLIGTGKTITYRMLESKLTDTLQVKFEGTASIDEAFREKTSRYEYWSDEFLQVFLELLHQYAGKTIHDIPGLNSQTIIYQVQTNLDRVIKGMGDTTNLLAQLIVNHTLDPEDKKRVIEAMPRIMKKLPKQLRKEIYNAIRTDDMAQIKNYIFDFEDYNPKSKGRMNTHLKELKAWWKELYTLEDKTSYWQDANIIIFWQKELWKDDMFFGKWETTELKPFTAQQLVEYYEKLWDTTAPFNKDALLKIASYSRGVFRRYKRYMAHCMTEYYTRKTPDYITIQEVKQWITFDRLLKDMEKELADTFKSTRLRRAVEILVYLDEHGETENTTIVEEIFEGGKSECSKVISKLKDKTLVTTRKEKGGKLLVRKV